MNTRPLASRIEPLEARIAPAAVFPYTDLDGDKVIVTTSKGTDAQLAAAATVSGGQLTLLNLSTNPIFAGTNLSIVATRDPAVGGDGLANVGRINAIGRDLGTVLVDGDLDAVDAGDGISATPAIKSLSVLSIGRFLGAGDDRQSVIDGTLGKLVVKTDVKEGTIQVVDTGGGGKGGIGSVTLGGSLLAGRITSAGDMGAVKIGQDVQGGTAIMSGRIDAGGKIASVSVRGSILGDMGDFSGTISAQGGSMGFAKIGGSVQGGVGDASGLLSASGQLAGASVVGSLTGGDGDNSGRISAGSMGAVKIGRDVQGGAGSNAGSIATAIGGVGGVTVGGSLIGDAGVGSGRISSTLALGLVKIGGDVQGGANLRAGTISAGTALAGATLVGSLLGGTKSDTGMIESVQQMGPVKIGGSIVGGSFTDETAADVGVVFAGGALTSISIGGDIQGGGLVVTSLMSSNTLTRSGHVQAQSIEKVFVGGSVLAGARFGATASVFGNGSIRVDDHLGAVTIAGSLLGFADNFPEEPAVISARGQAAPVGATDLAIKSLTIGGRVEYADILAGYDVNLQPRNADAQIGKVTVGGNWIASDLVAGVKSDGGAGAFGYFGEGNNPVISGAGTTNRVGVVSKIASIVIKGQVLGSAFSMDHFGFVAQHIVKFSVGGTAFTLAANASTDLAGLPIGLTADVRVREV